MMVGPAIMASIIFVTHEQAVRVSLAYLLGVLAFLLFRRRASVVMPKVRDWMNANSWVVNIVVSVLFILLILA
jgi:hypothetical protein